MPMTTTVISSPALSLSKESAYSKMLLAMKSQSSGALSSMMARSFYKSIDAPSYFFPACAMPSVKETTIMPGANGSS